MDGRTPFPVPPSFRVLLQCQKFCHHVNKTMVAYLEDSQGVSAHMVRLLEDEWTNMQRLIISDRAGKQAFRSIIWKNVLIII